MARVFISYRRSESKWMAGRLYDRIAEVLGRENVFFDVSNIEPGEDFVLRISEIVGGCDVLLAIIGPNWISVQDDSGRRRLDNPRDLIRIEVGVALQRNIRVIPILVDGASMPEEYQLPEELAPLVRRNAHDVSFSHFHTDLDSFIRVLQRIIAGPSPTVQTTWQAEQAHAESRSSRTVATELPFTISLETLGGVATPLIQKGARLPAEASDIFSTAQDNQSSVEISLSLGDGALAKDNVPVGKFVLEGIPPAAKAVPQILIKTIIDPALILTVTAEDQATHQKQVLDAVDLTRINIPPEILKEGAQAPRTQESTKDSPLDLGQEAGDFEGRKHPKKNFQDFFDTLFGSSTKNLDLHLEMTISASEAAAGVERTIELAGGKQIKVKIPAEIRTGQRLRLRGLGKQQGGKTGDLYILIRVGNQRQ
jgi:hypothetical protein